jgi:hypothetical protein
MANIFMKINGNILGNSRFFEGSLMEMNIEGNSAETFILILVFRAF